ncbi:MAG: LicD family protein [Verrucomicrobia bacterium]|nr:LicD family protein [Verrucomicrobiota bacterium]
MVKIGSIKKIKSQLQISALQVILIAGCCATAHAQENPTDSETSYSASDAPAATAESKPSSIAKSPNAPQNGVQQIKPVHIVRDVMQPLGMPVVTSFHNIRENLFLNMHTHNASGLEAIGDFFLAPSRYLFAGKTVKLLEEGHLPFELEQSFHYHTMHWLKTTLSLVVLPVTELIGAALKGLSYLSPQVREKHRLIRSGLKAAIVSSNIEKYREMGISKLYSNDHIPCLHYKRPSILTKKQQVEIQAFKDVANILEKHDIVYWVDFGTCLGAYRYGGIIPWDWDIDISILLPDHDNVKRVLSQLDPEKYQIQDWSSYSNPRTFLKLYVKETKNFIDIMHYKLDEEKKEASYFFTYQHSPMPHSWKKDELRGLKPVKFETLFPLKKANFDGLTVWAPNDVETYLKSKYDNNLEPSNIWDEEAQCYRKVENHPYWSE